MFKAGVEIYFACHNIHSSSQIQHAAQKQHRCNLIWNVFWHVRYICSGVSLWGCINLSACGVSVHKKYVTKKKKSSCYLQTLASRAEFSYLNYVKASQWCGAVGSEKPCCYLRKHAKIGLYCLMRLCSCHVLPWQTNKAQTAAQIALSEQPLRLSGQESSWNEGRFR